MDMEYCAAAEQQLCRLRQHVLVAPCASPAAMAGALEGVARVYEHAESLARSARADQVEGELEASVALLDACAAARDALGGLRARALDVEAAVRRRDGAAADVAVVELIELGLACTQHSPALRPTMADGLKDRCSSLKGGGVN